MKKIILLALVLSACSPITTALPKTTSTKLPTLIPLRTELQRQIFTNTPASTLESISGGWSIFQSSAYGFRFQYPAVYDEGFYNPIDKLSVCNFQSGKDDEGKFNIWIGLIRIITNKEIRDLNDFSNSYFNEVKAKWDITEINEIMMDDDIPAISFEYGHEDRSTYGYETIVTHNQNVIIINYYQPNFVVCDPPDSDYSSYWVYEQIIKTWKFDE